MNIDQDLILAKINNIQNCLNSIKTYTRNFDINSLDEIMVQDLVVLNLERAIQACIDLDLDILKSVVKNNLKDFEEFYKIILEKTKSK